MRRAPGSDAPELGDVATQSLSALMCLFVFLCVCVLVLIFEMFMLLRGPFLIVQELEKKKKRAWEIFLWGRFCIA